MTFVSGAQSLEWPRSPVLGCGLRKIHKTSNSVAIYKIQNSDIAPTLGDVRLGLIPRALAHGLELSDAPLPLLLPLIDPARVWGRLA
jgi:hypothetical protein